MTARRPTQMGFENLPHIHARWHTQRVQHDIDRRSVIKIGHVFHRHDARNHTLVAMTSGHLVARLQLALHGHEDLDQLHHARRQLVATLQLVDLVLEPGLKRCDGPVEAVLQLLDFGHAASFLHDDLTPLPGVKSPSTAR